MIRENVVTESLAYQVGLSSRREMVISSHFMHRISQDASLQLYDHRHFESKRLVVGREFVTALIPILKSACNAFCEKRAAVAKRRALAQYESFGCVNESEIGASEIITEALLDKEFSRNGAKYNSRHDLNLKIKRMLDEQQAIGMTMPALPFKIPSPLKSRGDLPDLGEINFLLSVYEIARTVEIICEQELGADAGVIVSFTIISDGSRFDDIVNESSATLKDYQAQLAGWITLIGIDDHVKLIDYRVLLRNRLPRDIWNTKLALFERAHGSYSEALWAVFDPDDMFASFEAARRVELDPEYGNAEGRFFSLFKSLVYTIKYKSLQKFRFCSEDQRAHVYRELTAHIFQPFEHDAGVDAQSTTSPRTNEASMILSTEKKESLRKDMLAEAWGAAINYISEIKSDRELPEDPILTCLPGYLRWTIHAKQGQLAIATPPILGMSVQPWAGSAVFRPAGKGGVRLCTLPSIVLEASHAIPVVLDDGDASCFSQPLFYLAKELWDGEIEQFLQVLRDAYTRQRFS